MNARVRELLPLAVWVAALVGALVAFTAMGNGQLAAPTLTDPGSWSGWAAGRDPVVATAAVLRLVVLALAWYLLGVTAVGAVARVARLTAMVRIADALSLPMVRRVLQTSLGVGLATAVAVSTTTATGSPTGPDPMLAAAAQGVEAEAPAPPRMRPLPPRETRRHEVPAPADDAAAEDGPRPMPGMHEVPAPLDRPAPMPVGDTTDPATVTVRPGDHLWSIAEQHLATRSSHAPTDDEVAPHWRRLIEANRDRLVDPANPDLILPGQQFVLPADTEDEGSRS